MKPIARLQATASLGVVAVLASVSLTMAQSAPTINWKEHETTDVCSEATLGVGRTFGLQAYSQGSGFDPTSITYSYEAAKQIYGSLMRFDPAKRTFEPWYAVSLQPNSTRDEWTLKLPGNATYSDGTKLNGAAVKKTIERFTNPELPNVYAPMLKLISSIDVIDDQTVIFKLKSAWGSFPWLLSQGPGAIINPKVLDRLSAKELAAGPPPEAGLGAFQLVEWTPNRNMVLKKKSDWWHGRVCIDTINVTWSGNGQQNLEAMIAGQIDYFRTFDSPALLGASKTAGLKIYRAPGVASTFDFNHESDAVKDVRVRQAIVRQANGEVINNRIWGGIGSGSHKLLPPSSPIAPDAGALEYDLNASKALVAEAVAGGWKKKFRFALNATPGNINQGVLQQAMAQAAGMEMAREELQIAEFLQKVRVQRNFDTAMGAFFEDYGCNWCAFTLFESGNSGNWTRSSFPEVDAVLVKLRGASGIEETKKTMNELQEVWNKVVPMGVTGWLTNSNIVSERAHGVLFGTDRNEVYLEKAYLTR